MSSATPDDTSVPDWLDASHYQTIAARRFADFYRQTLHGAVAASADSSTNPSVIQEEAAQLILQRLDAFDQQRVKVDQVDQPDQDTQGDQA